MSFQAIVDRLALFSIFSSGGHLVQWSGTKIAILKAGN